MALFLKVPEQPGAYRSCLPCTREPQKGLEHSLISPGPCLLFLMIEMVAAAAFPGASGTKFNPGSERAPRGRLTHDYRSSEHTALPCSSLRSPGKGREEDTPSLPHPGQPRRTHTAPRAGVPLLPSLGGGHPELPELWKQLPDHPLGCFSRTSHAQDSSRVAHPPHGDSPRAPGPLPPKGAHRRPAAKTHKASRPRHCGEGQGSPAAWRGSQASSHSVSL